MGTLERIPPAGALTGQGRDAVLAELIDRHANVLLATPYFNVEGRLLERSGEVLKLRVPLGEAAARHVLSQKPLRLRVPWACSMVAGETILLGMEREEQRLMLRLSVPAWLAPDERRGAPRAEGVDVRGALALEDDRVVRVRVENLSESGAGLMLIEPLGTVVGHRGYLSLALGAGPDLNVPLRVIREAEPFLGVRWEPCLEGRSLERLRAWLKPRLDEAKRRWENRAELRALAEAARKPKAPPSGVVVLGTELESELRPILEDLAPVRFVAPVRTDWEAALTQRPPCLVLVGIPDHPEARHRLRRLLEHVPPPCPVLALGSMALGAEERAWAMTFRPEAVLAWAPNRAEFLRRWVQGLLRRCGGQGSEGG